MIIVAPGQFPAISSEARFNRIEMIIEKSVAAAFEPRGTINPLVETRFAPRISRDKSAAISGCQPLEVAAAIRLLSIP